MDETRHARLTHTLQHELSAMLMKGEIKDHRVNSLISFSYLKLAKDGSTARVGVSSILDHAAVDRAVEGLNSAAGFLQRRLGRILKVRVPPRLYFVPDHSIEEGQEVIRTIESLVHDEERNSAPQQTDGD